MNPQPNEDLPLIGPASAPTAIPRSSTFTPLLIDERAISRLLETILSRGGMSVSECARRLGVTPQAIRQYLHGRRSPGLLQFLRIAEVCGAKVQVELPR